MTTTTVVHSNAFNFLSFLQHTVDPRTGQYTLSIELPELVGNDLSGPSLPLRLAFNPLNDQDSGFGHGWILNLSQYVPATNMLSLHTGDSFKVTGSGDQPDIRERKLETFHFHKDSAERFRVVHKSGLVEVLESRGPSTNRVALPTRVEAPSGHWIELSYGDYYGAPCLTSIIDGSGVKLLALSYSDGQVLIDLHPEAGPGGTPLARYQVNLDKRGRANKRLPFEVVLPSEDNASWRFEYEHFEDRNLQQLACLKTVHTPVGGTERIEYLDDGHRFPEAANPSLTPAPLPRVTRHVIEPGFDQPDMVTEYAYTTNNFLGRGATGVVWREDGEDNLYQFAGTGFSYGSTVSYLQAGKALRTVSRSFNRFHLLTLQCSEEAGCIEETETTYPEVEGRTFEQQPNYFQLPHRVLKRWRRSESNIPPREEVTSTLYDGYGNLTEEVQASGLRTFYTYYPLGGEMGKDAEGNPVELCPADPHAFVRSIKAMTVEPSSDGEGEAASLRTDYRYSKLEPISQANPETWRTGWLLPDHEDQSALQGAQLTPLEQIVRTYVQAPTDALRHGRIEQETITRNGLATRIESAYQTGADVGYGVLQTVQTITGFDHDSERHARKVVTLRQSVLLNQPLLNRDDNDVEIAYEYDALRRVIKETVSPNEPDFTASRHYRYNLVSGGSRQALQTMVDVKGVTTRSWVDGLNRLVLEERQDADNPSLLAAEQFRRTQVVLHDSLGNVVEHTEFDWLDDIEGGEWTPRELALKTHFEFDSWGQQYCETGPDGVRHFEQTDPIGTLQSKGPIVRAWSESADGTLKSGTMVTWLNLFEQPTRIERFTQDNQAYSVEEHFYDGLGRKVREVDARKAVKRYAYDAFDRLLDETLADSAVVHRDYAAHSREDLPVLIKVNDVVLGEQRFDGLDRMIESVTGGRRRQFAFAPGQRQPASVLTPSGQLIEYVYQPQLGEEPLQRRIAAANVQADYRYDKHNARLLACEEQGQTLEREYFSTGEVKLETVANQSEPYTMHYRTSLQARQLAYVDVLGQTQTYRYDSAGRLVFTQLGSTESTFAYDELGRQCLIRTQDGQQQLSTQLRYDDFDREISRTFDFGETTQVLTQSYDVRDALVTKTLQEGDELLRYETYQYDDRARLTRYECEGPQAPVDPYGQVITMQLFRLDALDNITRVRTTFPGGSNTATYLFDNADPVQLSAITNDAPLHGYPARIDLEYDADGNLTRDEVGRTLSYDGLGRLTSVTVPEGQASEYGYDPLDRLVSQSS
ncbi:YD repeat-containing protein [Pseudomonas hunanensis]|uniref:YD repeat-containing protein n=1 Tax=Pseudomonas hunanensis TaxID=1247546 RepID=A0ACC6K8A9_9PSED|nr:sugar-binding protein [Pseudomonas hunanensis]MDR6714640.1 YD repeat-containing protein [Pseudomonas hunanensis]